MRIHNEHRTSFIEQVLSIFPIQKNNVIFLFLEDKRICLCVCFSKTRMYFFWFSVNENNIIQISVLLKISYKYLNIHCYPVQELTLVFTLTKSFYVDCSQQLLFQFNVHYKSRNYFQGQSDCWIYRN